MYSQKKIRLEVTDNKNQPLEDAEIFLRDTARGRSDVKGIVWIDGKHLFDKGFFKIVKPGYQTKNGFHIKFYEKDTIHASVELIRWNNGQ